MAMNMDAALTLRAKVEGANSIVDFNRTLTGVETSAKSVTGALKGMTGAAGGLSGALSALTPVLSVVGLVGLAKGALDAGQKMLHMSEKTGVSVEQLAKFKKAASLTNTDLETVGKSIVKLDKNMVDAFANGKSAKYFDAIGVSVKNSSGKLRDNNAVMLDVANRFHEMPDGAAKTAIALGLFGKAGAEMIPMLNQGGDAISKLSTKMTAAFAEKADEYKKKLAALGGQINALGMDLAEALLPALEKITTAVTAGVQAFNKLPEPIKELAIGGALLAIAWGPLTSIVSGSMAVFAGITAAIEAFQLQLGLAAMEGIPAFSAAILAIPGWGWALAGVAAIGLLGGALYANNDQFRNWVNNVGTIVSGDFQNAMKMAVDFSNAAVKAISDGFNNLAKYLKDVSKDIAVNFGGMFSGIERWWNSLPKDFRDMQAKSLPFAAGAFALAPFGPLASIVGGYGTNVGVRALAMPPQPETSSTPKGPKLGVYSPDIDALSKNGLGKLDTASLDQANQLEADKKRLLILQQQDAIQKEIDADLLRQSQYARDKNVSGEREIKATIAELEYQKEKVKIEANYQRALQENIRKYKTDENKLQADQNALTERNLQLDQAREKANKTIATDLQSATFALQDQARAQRNAIEDIENRYNYAKIGSEQGRVAEQKQRDLDGLDRQLRDQAINAHEYNGRLQAINKSYEDMARLGGDAFHGLKQGVQSYIESIGTLADGIGKLTSDSFKGMTDALVNFVTTGKASFSEFANSVIKDMVRIAIEQAIIKPLLSALRGMLSPASAAGSSGFNMALMDKYSPFANGGIMTAMGPMPLRAYASGGIATSPQMALFGEGSQPEAYVPLPDGRRIPVAMKAGGSSPIINVAVDAKGTSVSGNGGQASQLGRVIAVAVQNELIKQKRPGGLIAA